MNVLASEVASDCRRGFSRLLLAAILLAIPAMLFGQAYFGTVSGVLTDPMGAVIQGAKVTLLDQDKGYKFSATSDNAGRYLFVSIPPGLYSVTAEMQGFEKTVRTHIKLNVTENATANLTLKVASATQSVEVRAQAQTIATEDAVTGEVIDRRAINDLPLVDRYALDLVYLTPGVTDASDANHVGDTGTNFVSNGSRSASADILMDGSSITNFEPNGGITAVTYSPSPEAIEEFKVQQSNFSAEYGFSGGSVVNMITRSGTNSFHGEAYDFIRNTITDANNWFASGSHPAGAPARLWRHFGRTYPQEQNLLLLRLGGNARKWHERVHGRRAQRRRTHRRFWRGVHVLRRLVRYQRRMRASAATRRGRSTILIAASMALIPQGRQGQ